MSMVATPSTATIPNNIRREVPFVFLNSIPIILPCLNAM
ncbi:hypothetical protein APS_1051 [Acetobacter pasteurianus subsp. pasteurianus LMG 1262 = NBRC 106471]|nr:hypothetical protein APS_1051 [Acetobacter pasteurianus subsp. pasteurianus LMG 1262 = NBRC 106471]